MTRNGPALLAVLVCSVLSAPARAQSSPVENLDEGAPIRTLAVGPFLLGEERPLLDLADFPVLVEGATAPIDAHWVPDSVQWIRAENGLALPRARLSVALRVPPERASLLWRGRTILFQSDGDGARTEFFAPLYAPAAALVQTDGRPAGRVRFEIRPAVARPAAARHAIDHSCTPWNVSVRGLDDSYLTMTCRMVPVGPLFGQEPFLEILWTATGVALPDGGAFPLTTALRDGRPAKATVIGRDGARRTVEISASLPARLPRMRLAAGVGPYRLTTNAGSGNGAAAAAMLYGNLRVNDNVSFRGFEAAVSQDPGSKAFFNNFGLYFAYDLKRFWDGRGKITALLGAQGLTYAPRGLGSASFNQVIAPQGFEFAYLHAFGFKNYTLAGGLFAQPSTTTPYANYWVRYGRRWFGELNYISWRSYERSARMWGLSVGFPVSQFL